MSTAEHGMHANPSPSKEHGFPWSHIVGFIISIVLTLVALWLVLNNMMTWAGLLFVILALAVLQILVQLFFFMHFTYSHGPKYHVVALSLGLIFTVAIVAGSIWIMTFGGYQSY